MRHFKKEEDGMVVLLPEFQKKLFSELLDKYNRDFLTKKLKKSSGLIYHYKNNVVGAIPKIVISRAIKLSNFSNKTLDSNTIRTFSAHEQIKKILDLGSEARKKQLKENLSILHSAYKCLNKKENPLILDVQEWLEKNQWLEKLNNQRGLIKDIKSKENKSNIKIFYQAYSKKTNKMESYKVSIPKLLAINYNLCYFLGLFYGDGLNGARVGIANKDIDLITWTAKFLKNTFNGNKIKSQLMICANTKGKNMANQSELLKSISDEFEIITNKKAKGDYVLNIFITNKILRRILDGFLDNLESLFLDLDNPAKGCFLAGFFDAEGNVNKLDRNLRFSQKIENKVKAIMGLLKKEGYHVRYDGSNILIGFKKEYKQDLDLFRNQIFPFLKHSKKTQQTKELLDGYFVREEYRPMLRIIVENPNIAHKEIAKSLNLVKCPQQLKALVEAGYLVRMGEAGESFKYAITDKGLEYLEKK